MPEALTALATAATTLSAAGIWNTMRQARKNAEAFRALMDRHTAERELPCSIHCAFCRHSAGEDCVCTR